MRAWIRVSVLGVAALLLLGTVPSPPAVGDVADVLQPELAAALAEPAADDGLLVFVHGTDADAARVAVDRSGLSLVAQWTLVGVMVAWGTPDQILAAAAADGVTYVEQDQPATFFSDTSHAATRGALLHDGALDVTGDGDGDVIDGSGTSIAIVDSGVDTTHPAFAREDGSTKVVRNVKSACPFVTPTSAEPAPPADTFFATCMVDAGPDSDTPSAGGHGTHVAGIAGAFPTVDDADRSLSGAAPGADLVSVSVGASLSIYGGGQGLYWVLEHHENPCVGSLDPTGPDPGTCHPIRVVNNSWGPLGGGDFDPESATAKIQRALLDAGVFVVWAAGNDGGDGSQNAVNPASQDPTPGVLSVANYDDADAGTRDGTVNGSSSRGDRERVGTYPDLAAPGTAITQACRIHLTVCGTGLDTADPDYNTITGTSMAAPHIAGIIAQLIQAAALEGRTVGPGGSGSDLSMGDLERALLDTADPVGDETAYVEDTRSPDAGTPTSFFAGHGLVDAADAAAQLVGVAAPDPGGAATQCDDLAGFTDPEGDATRVVVDTPLPSEPGLDIVAGHLSSSASETVTDGHDITFHLRMADVPEQPGGTEGNGEYIDYSFALEGSTVTGVYVQPRRTATAGASFVLGRLGSTGRETLATGLPGSFDPDTDEIAVTLPAEVAASALGVTPVDGTEVSGIEAVARREVLLVVPDADSAKGACTFAVAGRTDDGGDGEDPASTAPSIEAVSVTPERPRVGQEVTVSVDAVDPDGDALEYGYDLGDGTTVTGSASTVTHTYDHGCRYTLTVTVSDDEASAQEQTEVHVRGRRGRDACDLGPAARPAANDTGTADVTAAGLARARGGPFSPPPLAWPALVLLTVTVHVWRRVARAVGVAVPPRHRLPPGS